MHLKAQFWIKSSNEVKFMTCGDGKVQASLNKEYLMGTCQNTFTVAVVVIVIVVVVEEELAT